MKPAEAFRQAARSFSGRDFAKDELKQEYINLVDGGSLDNHFKEYFRNFQKKSFRGLQIISTGANSYNIINTSLSNRRQSQRRNNIPRTRQTNSNRPIINYSVSSITIPPYGFFRSFVRTNRLSSTNDIVHLTSANASIVESLIQSDPNYQPNAERKYASFCSLDADGNPDYKTFDFSNAAHLLEVIQEINKDNSTFDFAITYRNRYPVSACQTFCNFIVNPSSGFPSILDSGCTNSITTLVETMKQKHTCYNAKSLASKVCKYLHQYYYDNDKFYINDKVVRSMLPFYLDYYGVNHSLLTKKDRDLSYPNLYRYLEDLRNAAQRVHGGQSIKRSELDHILWYCYKMFKNREL